MLIQALLLTKPFFLSSLQVKISWKWRAHCASVLSYIVQVEASAREGFKAHCSIFCLFRPSLSVLEWESWVELGKKHDTRTPNQVLQLVLPPNCFPLKSPCPPLQNENIGLDHTFWKGGNIAPWQAKINSWRIRKFLLTTLVCDLSKLNPNPQNNIV